MLVIREIAFVLITGSARLGLLVKPARSPHTRRVKKIAVSVTKKPLPEKEAKPGTKPPVRNLPIRQGGVASRSAALGSRTRHLRRRRNTQYQWRRSLIRWLVSLQSKRQPGHRCVSPGGVLPPSHELQLLQQARSMDHASLARTN